MSIESATLAATGAPTVTVKFTDAAGTPIDLLAEITANKISPRFTLASRAGGAYLSLYESNVAGTSYVGLDGTTKTPALTTAKQASYVPGRTATITDIVGMWSKVSDGVYKFTFPAAPATAPTLTDVHTFGLYATRTFDSVAYPNHAAYDFTPSTGAVATKREIVSDTACNGCHQNLQAHGTRRGVRLCVTCHNAGTTDPETGNTVDFGIMVHKIHSGKDGYNIVGYGGRIFDFSKVAFAPPTNSVTNCTACHQGAEADNHKTKLSRAICGSCHTNVDFAVTNPTNPMYHKGGPQTTDACASSCHSADSIAKYHSAKYDTLNNLLFTGKTAEITIDDVTNVAVDQSPVIKFTAKVDGVAVDLTTTPLQSLRFTIGGPTTDYAGAGAPHPLGYFQLTPVQTGTSKDIVSTGTPGQFTYTPPSTATKIASTASGSIGVGVEAVVRETLLENQGITCSTTAPCATGQICDAGSCKIARTKDYAAKLTPVVYRKIGGGTAVARRSIVDDKKCNNCHVDLGFHGTRARKGVEYCVMCHNPNNVNDERISRYETDPLTSTPWTVEPQSVQFAVMIHKIHAAGQFSKGYALGAMPSPSSTNPAGTVGKFEGLFPGDLGNCETCHKPGTYGLPKSTYLPTKYETWTCAEPSSTDTDNLCNGSDTAGNYWRTIPEKTRYVLPQKSICTSCHSQPATGAHADIMTVGTTESCATCHGAGRASDPSVVHKPKP